MRNNQTEPLWLVVVIIGALFIFIALAFGWLLRDTHLPLWAATLVVAPETVFWAFSIFVWARGGNAHKLKPRKFEMIAFFTCGISTLYGAIYAANFLFLVYLYGFPRVRHEHLRFVVMPKGSPWIVSNGDQVGDGQFLHFLMSIGIWVAIVVPVLSCVYRLLPERK